MTSPGGKLTTLVCHPTKKVNKAEEQTYLSTKNRENLVENCCFRVLLAADASSFFT
jgi:hypothetical protein